MHGRGCVRGIRTILGRNEYFVIFIDDANRMDFVYFLKANKKDVFEAYKEFKTYSEAQTGKKL